MQCNKRESSGSAHREFGFLMSNLLMVLLPYFSSSPTETARTVMLSADPLR